MHCNAVRLKCDPEAGCFIARSDPPEHLLILKDAIVDSNQKRCASVLVFAGVMQFHLLFSGSLRIPKDLRNMLLLSFLQ